VTSTDSRWNVEPGSGMTQGIAVDERAILSTTLESEACRVVGFVRSPFSWVRTRALTFNQEVAEGQPSFNRVSSSR
jgi:hypothetical protein